MSATLGPLAAVRLVTAEATGLAAFYAEAFGFVPGPTGPDPFASGRVQSLTLGRQRLDLVTPLSPGRPYPAEAGSADTIFQHVALVVTDMNAAMARLRAVRGWTPISTHGPERLPESSGGVSAFKFRDPEGHPLEFLQFPAGAEPAAWRGAGPGPCVGFDHSAITVSDTARSLAFYARLGLVPAARSLNRGPEQSRMDAQPGAVVEVTGLDVPGAPPHLELLHYRGGTRCSACADGDVAATQLVFTMPGHAALATLLARVVGPRSAADVSGHEGAGAALLRDPDGHRLWLTALDA